MMCDAEQDVPVMEEFADPVEMSTRFGPRISMAEFERQSRQCTGEALSELVDELKRRPRLFTDVLDRRQGEDLT